MGLKKSASSGDRLAILNDLRGILAARIDNPTTLDKDVAALTGRLQAVLSEIAELAPPEQKGDAIDEITKRRAARRPSTTKGSGNSKRSG